VLQIFDNPENVHNAKEAVTVAAETTREGLGCAFWIFIYAVTFAFTMIALVVGANQLGIRVEKGEVAIIVVISLATAWFVVNTFSPYGLK